MIKAIQTKYDGYRFRSRLEARWATFFNYAGIPYQYEIEGYETSNGNWYLPDFYLPECGLWVEVKGFTESIDYDWLIERARALPVPEPETIQREEFSGLMLVGEIPRVPAPYQNPRNARWDFSLDFDFFWPVAQPRESRESIDPNDDPLILAGFGRYEKNRRPWFANDPLVAGRTYPLGSFDLCMDGEYMDERIRRAYREARRARFEHGETPAA